MEATELKIGDIVSYQGEVVKITNFIYTHCLFCDKDGDVYTGHNVADLDPIPLTEEILEENGWHKQTSNGEMQGWSNGQVKLYPQDRKSGGGFTFVYSGNAARYIHCVHELQHLLWALGLDDNLTF